MLRSRLNAFEQTRADTAPVLDIKDPQAHRHYLYGASGKDYIGNRRGFTTAIALGRGFPTPCISMAAPST